MVRQKDDIYLRCDKCHRIIRFSKDRSMLTTRHYDHGEYGMGMEICYYIDNNGTCDICGNSIDLSISVAEYPEGALDSINYDINGGCIVKEPRIELDYQQYIKSSDLASLMSIIRARNITSVYHFTKAENVESILRLGIIPRSLLENETSINSSFNDYWRYDGCKDANCVSISFPNYKMFYSLRCENRESEWAVLEIDAQVLVDCDCIFCQKNAGSADMFNQSIISRKGSAAFAKLFMDSIGVPSRQEMNIPPNYPTDPQAEVLVCEIIRPEYIKSVSFNDIETYNKYRGLKLYGVNVLKNDNLFGPRSDYVYWR